MTGTGTTRWRRVRKVAAVIGGLLAAVGAYALFLAFYNPSVPLAPPLELTRHRRGPEVTVLLAGDFAPTAYAMPNIEEHGYRYPYLATRAYFAAADVSFANLEAPITTREESFWPYKDWLYKVDPEAVPTWEWVGLDLVSLANNHLIDYRVAGVHDTLYHLEEGGIDQVGAGLSESAARRPVIFDVDGTRVGFLAYLEHKAVFSTYLQTFAVDHTVGCAQLNRADAEQDIRRLRPLVDILIVSVHWGDNYAPVTDTEKEYARFFADLGVDVVAGHHPHDVQPIEIIDRTVVFYSLGNWTWGARGWDHFRIGMLAQLRITPRHGDTPGRLAGVDVVPIAVQNRIVDYQSRPLEPGEEEWVEPLIADSAALGTDLSFDGRTLHLALPDD